MGEQAAFTAPYFLGIDLGGTNVKAGVVDDRGQAMSSVSEPTRAEMGPEKGLVNICQAAYAAIGKAGVTIHDIVAVGIGSPGPMDLKKQIIINPHNLPGWLDLPLADLVGKQLGLPAVLQNDANAAAYGEFWVGAGRDANSLVQFTLGTGIGCGIVIGGRIHEGEHSHGAESGHMRISLDNSRRNGTGLYGSLEAYASATAVVARTKEALLAGAESNLRQIIARGEKLQAREIFAAAAAGDALADHIVEDTAFYLAIGAVNLMHTIDPDMVVFSGGMIQSGEPFLNRIRKHVKANALPVPGERTAILFAKLGANAGFIGAAGCARLKFATSPS